MLPRVFISHSSDSMLLQITPCSYVMLV